jgi:UDP-N-acetylmuramoyl-tripeptide--D-alanyl-D-alanine ligase
MNHPGEIALLARLAAPTVAMVNNAQREHQEFMASVEAVAQENGAVLQALPASGVAVLPAGDPMCALWRQMAGAREVRTFALAGDAGADTADAFAQASWDAPAQAWEVSMRLGGSPLHLRLAQPGLHNVRNALAAALCAQAAGEPLSAIQQGLEAFRPVKGRSQVRALAWAGRTATLVDDSYNANPDSVLAAIDVLKGLPGPHWLVLGDMGEVGTQGPAFHAEVGARAREGGLEHLWCVGSLAAGTAQAARDGAMSVAAAGAGAVRHFETVDSLLGALNHAAAAGELPAAASILVKGSRFMRMERVVDALVGLSAASPLPQQAPAATPEGPSCC